MFKHLSEGVEAPATRAPGRRREFLQVVNVEERKKKKNKKSRLFIGCKTWYNAAAAKVLACFTENADRFSFAPSRRPSSVTFLFYHGEEDFYKKVVLFIRLCYIYVTNESIPRLTSLYPPPPRCGLKCCLISEFGVQSGPSRTLELLKVRRLSNSFCLLAVKQERLTQCVRKIRFRSTSHSRVGTTRDLGWNACPLGESCLEINERGSTHNYPAVCLAARPPPRDLRPPSPRKVRV